MDAQVAGVGGGAVTLEAHVCPAVTTYPRTRPCVVLQHATLPAHVRLAAMKGLTLEARRGREEGSCGREGPARPYK